MNWKNLRRVVALFAVLVSFGFVYASASAATLRFAMTTACSSGCHDYENWSGISIHGARSTVEVSNPSVSGSDYFEKYIHLKTSYNNSNCYAPPCDLEIMVGEETNAGICSGSATQFFYGIYDDGFGGTGSSWYYNCFSLHTGDANADATFGTSYYTSNGGGFFFFIYGTGSRNNPCPSSGSCSFQDPNSSVTFSNSYLEQQYQRSSFSGHAVWGTDWINNQYFVTSWANDSTDGVQYFINNSGNSNEPGGDLCSIDNTRTGVPTQLCWSTRPSTSGSNGGTLYMCDYDSTTNTCTLSS